MRVSKRIVAEQFVPTSTTPPSDVGIYRVNRKALGVTGRIDTFDPETKVLSSMAQTLFQSGIPFWIPPGDAGANGLSFTGTRGVFTLSAESPLANAWLYLAGGCYVYLPAGSGGLASGGLFWCVLTGATAGEVYSNTHFGIGVPVRHDVPIQMPDLSAGRITQTVSEVNFASFILPGNSMGRNGVYVSKIRNVCTNSATTKTTRLRISNATTDTRLWALGITTSYNVLGAQFTGYSSGNNRIIKCAGNSSTNATWDNPSSQPTATTSDVLTVDLTSDQTITLSGQLAANTDSLIVIPGQFCVQFGE